MLQNRTHFRVMKICRLMNCFISMVFLPRPPHLGRLEVQDFGVCPVDDAGEGEAFLSPDAQGRRLSRQDPVVERRVPSLEHDDPAG